MISKFTKGVVLASAVFSLVAPAYAADVVVAGNGYKANVSVTLKTKQETSVTQTAVTQVLNEVTTVASTGNVKANKNTGGGVSVTTGDAQATSSVTNYGSENNAVVLNDCGCLPIPSVAVKNNGSESTVTVKLKQKTVEDYLQSSQTVFANGVFTKASTGKVKTNKNTGPGTVEVTTGTGVSATEILNTGSLNNLSVGGSL